MGWEGGGERGVCFLGKVKEIIIRGTVFDFQGVCGEAKAVRKGTAWFYSPWCLLFSATGHVYFQNCACKPRRACDTQSCGSTRQWGDRSSDAVQLVTRSPVGGLCSCLSVSGKIKEAASFPAIWIHFPVMSWRVRQEPARLWSHKVCFVGGRETLQRKGSRMSARQVRQAEKAGSSLAIFFLGPLILIPQIFRREGQRKSSSTPISLHKNPICENPKSLKVYIIR